MTRYRRTKASNEEETDAIKAERKDTAPSDVRIEILLFSSVISKRPANMPVLLKVDSKQCCGKTTDRASLQNAAIRCN